MTSLRFAQRLASLQTNVFADMDQAKAEAKKAGQTIVDLSLGSSDLPTPNSILEVIAANLQDKSTHGYLLHNHTQAFRQAVGAWYSKRFGVEVDPDTEVLALIGSQEGTAHLPLALLNPGDFALLLDPGYPSHAGGVYLAGGQIYTLPLLQENNFLPDLTNIPAAVLSQARLLVLSYPHNPTTAIASLDFFSTAVAFCQANNLVLVHDFPYMDIYFPPTDAPPSILQADRAKSVSIEFFTFSKSYNMGGFRIGFAIGNEQLIKALRQIKAVVDFNQYQGILAGAIAALQGEQTSVQDTVNTYQKRRDRMIAALKEMGWVVPTPPATLYIWAKLLPLWSGSSLDFCRQLVAATGVALSPGSGFGQGGEGYVRFALVHEPEILEEAVEKIKRFLYP